MADIKYLFPPDQINKLPTWRFVLHFVVPPSFGEAELNRAKDLLGAAQWRIIGFPFGLNDLSIRKEARTMLVSVPIEVPADRRKRASALADYESDVWKIFGNMASCGAANLFYQAVDWKDDA